MNPMHEGQAATLAGFGFAVNVPNPRPWPDKDEYHAPGGPYDENTEAGRKNYRRAYMDNVPSAHPGEPWIYMPTLAGYPEIIANRALVSSEGARWYADELTRQARVGAGMGDPPSVTQGIIDERQAWVKVLTDRGESWAPQPEEPKDSATQPPQPPHDPSRGR